MSTIPTLHKSIHTPIGWIDVVGTGQGISAIEFRDEDPGSDTEVPACVEEAITQLRAYFDGRLRQFDLLLAPQGTAFQQDVWRLLTSVAFGQTRSYMDLALALKNEKAIRAVGAANGRNPIAVVIPCHRIVGSDGSLTGYAGGLWRKEWLLRHEREQLYGRQATLFS